jgi:hypothetical protein
MPNPATAAVFRQRLHAISSLANRTNKATVLVVQQFPVVQDTGVLFPHVRESIANIMAFVELGTAADLSWALDAAREHSFNWIAVDCDQKLLESTRIIEVARARIDSAQLLFYSDNQVWFDSGLDIVQRLEGGLTGKPVLLCGTGPLADCFREALPRIGSSPIAPEQVGAGQDAPAIVLGVAQKRETIDAALVDRMPSDAAIYDIGLGNLSMEAAAGARARGLRLYRLDNRAGISSAIVRLLETDFMVGKLMGHVRLKHVDIVAGGLLAPPGAVIVDDIRNPTLIFGVADGRGRFREPLDREDEERVKFVHSLMRSQTEPVS